MAMIPEEEIDRIWGQESATIKKYFAEHRAEREAETQQNEADKLEGDHPPRHCPVTEDENDEPPPPARESVRHAPARNSLFASRMSFRKTARRCSTRRRAWCRRATASRGPAGRTGGIAGG